MHVCLFAYYVCVCDIGVASVDLCMHVFRYTRKCDFLMVQVDFEYILWLLSIHLYIFETGPLTEPETHWFGWSLSFEMHLSLYSPPSTPNCNTQLFKWVLKIWTQVLMLPWQALWWVSHFSSHLYLLINKVFLLCILFQRCCFTKNLNFYNETNER